MTSFANRHVINLHFLAMILTEKSCNYDVTMIFVRSQVENWNLGFLGIPVYARWLFNGTILVVVHIRVMKHYVTVTANRFCQRITLLTDFKSSSIFVKYFKHQPTKMVMFQLVMEWSKILWFSLHEFFQ